MPETLGPYRLIRRIGRGGMGTVYEGVHLETGERAAVKSLAADLGSEADFRQRFGLEIETLRRLNHPSIVRLFGFGEQDGQLFYSMELVEGVSIETELRRGRRFSWKETIEIGKQISLALRHAHDRGIIHRDLKPANLILAPDNRVKLADFGIARLFGDARITTAGGVIGTVEYMAPEQASAQPINHRADLYALGGVLFALLAGRPPLVSRSLPEMLEKLKKERPERVDRIARDVPVELAILIEQLLEKDPKRRVANAMLVERRLEAIEHGLQYEQSLRQAAAAHAMELDSDFDLGDSTDAKKKPKILPRSTPTNLAITQPLDSQETPHKKILPLDRTLPLESDASQVETPREDSTYAHDPMARAQTITDVLPLSSSDQGSSATRTMSEQEKEEYKKRTDKNNAVIDNDSGSSHFVEVAEEELDRAFVDEGHSALVSLHTWILTGCLVVVGLTIWYFLQPPTADSLYNKIQQAAEDGTIDSLRDAKHEINDFLERYPNDSRAKIVRDYEQDLKLYQLERLFENSMKDLSVGKSLDPVQLAVLEGKRYLLFEPEIGMQKLQAVVDLYAHEQPTSSTADLSVELAKSHIRRLQKELKETAESHHDLLEAQLKRAAALRETDPARARAMYRAIITLYGDKSWAKDTVDRAKQALSIAEESEKNPLEQPPPSPI